MQLSPTQTLVLEFISETIRSTGVPPTIREVAEATGLSFTKSRVTMMALESLGCILRTRQKFRAIQVLRMPEAA
jgi:SOS-response transcriptional repressor LexA